MWTFSLTGILKEDPAEDLGFKWKLVESGGSPREGGGQVADAPRIA